MEWEEWSKINKKEGVDDDDADGNDRSNGIFR